MKKRVGRRRGEGAKGDEIGVVLQSCSGKAAVSALCVWTKFNCHAGVMSMQRRVADCKFDFQAGRH